MIYDVALIGSGPANLFAAMEILKNSNLKVILIEKAKRLNDSRNVSLGWLGGSSRASTTLFMEPGFGGEIANNELLDTFASRFEEYSSSKLKFSKKKLLKKSKKKALDLGIEVDEPKAASCTEDRMIKLGDFLYSSIKKEATIIHKIDISKIDKVGPVFHIESNESTIKAKKVVLGIGRDGSSWLREKCSNFNLSKKGSSYSLGLRIEFPNYLLKSFADKGANFRFRFGDFRTTVPIYTGTIETEEIGTLKLSNGRAWGRKKTHFANFALLKEFKSKEPLKDALRVSEIINVLSEEQLLRETVPSILTRKHLAEHIPEFKEVVDGLEKIISLLPEIKKKGVVYAPEARINVERFDLSKDMETTVKDLFIVGDMSGKTRSFVQAACSGLVAAEKIIKECKKMSEQVMIEPFYDRVVLRVLNHKTTGKLTLGKEVGSSVRAEVVAVGPGKFNFDKDRYVKMHAKEGDVVYINAQLGMKLSFGLDTEEFVLMRDEDILGKEISK